MALDDVFAVIAETTRREILSSLAGERKSVGQLVDELGVSQPTVSKHLRVLREAGVVAMRAEGQKRFYSLSPERLSPVTHWLETLGAGNGSTPASPGAGPRAVATSGEVSVAPAPVAASAVAAGPGDSGALAAGSVDSGAVASPPVGGRPSGAHAVAPPVAEPVSPVPEEGEVAAAVVVRALDSDGTRPQQLGRTVGRAANKAADILANLPAFRRRRD